MRSTTTFEQRLSRIAAGESRAVPIPGPQNAPTPLPRRHRFQLEGWIVGGLAGVVAGTLFKSVIGLTHLTTLDWPTLVSLVQTDPVTGLHIASVAVVPVLFVAALIFSTRAPKLFHAATGYGLGVIGSNFNDARFYVETVAIPAFWRFVEGYTAAAGVLS